ncbi:replication initiation protein [Enterococcus sp. AZ102]|uniref:replication initiation protein n=1 Tax=unclassified Enterococcus TaxID=2608891 RepID=UPI003F221414
MSNEIVKYHNELNTIPLRKFTPVEMNLFFSIVSRMRDKGDTTVRFTFDQLKDLSNYKATANKRFIDDLKTTYIKLLQLHFGRTSQTGLSFEAFVMFTEFKINGDIEVPYVDIQVHKKAIPLLNDLDSWVRYSLQQFNELQSSYSKTMFRLLKQFRTKGFAYFSKEDLFELLDIPKSYWNKQVNVDTRVITPIRQELTAIFLGLTITKKYGKGRGKPVIGYQFSFKPEPKNANDFNKHAPTKIEQDAALIKANAQLEVEKEYSVQDKVKQKQREIELLEQYIALQKLEMTKEKLITPKPKEEKSSRMTTEDKRELLSGLRNLFSEQD